MITKKEVKKHLDKSDCFLCSKTCHTAKEVIMVIGATVTNKSLNDKWKDGTRRMVVYHLDCWKEMAGEEFVFETEGVNDPCMICGVKPRADKLSVCSECILKECR